MDALRKFLKTPAGRAAGIVLSIAFVALAALVLRRSLGDNAATAASRTRPFICAKTGKTFTYELERGDMLPVQSPHSGEKSGYPAEPCYWTADGGTKAEPTWVLLNEYAGKPGRTYCPDCNRLVTPLNQPPEAGMKPPPKRDEARPSTEKR